MSSAHCERSKQRRDQLAGSETCNTTETFRIYRPAMGLDRFAENTINLQKCFIDVADLLQICRKTLSFCFCCVLSV